MLWASPSFRHTQHSHLLHPIPTQGVNGAYIPLGGVGVRDHVADYFRKNNVRFLEGVKDLQFGRVGNSNVIHNDKLGRQGTSALRIHICVRDR